MKTPTRPKRPVASRRGTPDDNLRKQLDQRTLELAEALEQQTATSDVLRGPALPERANAVMARSISDASRASTGVRSTPKDGATAWSPSSPWQKGFAESNHMH